MKKTLLFAILFAFILVGIAQAQIGTNEITVTNILAGESAMLKLFRDVNDTYGQGIGVAGIEIKYKARVLMADRY